MIHTFEKLVSTLISLEGNTATCHVEGVGYTTFKLDYKNCQAVSDQETIKMKKLDNPVTSSGLKKYPRPCQINLLEKL
jgi:hypothetical protein